MARTQLSFFADLITQGPQAAFENFHKSMTNLAADIIARVPWLSDAFKAMGGEMSGAVSGVISLWERFVGLISWGVEKFRGAIDTIKGLHGSGARLFGFDPEGPGQAAAARAGAPAPGGAAVAPAGGVAVNAAGRPNVVFMDEATKTGLSAGRQQMAAAASTPLVSQTSNSIANSTTRTSTRQTDVRIDKVEVNTQATDPKGVSDAVSTGLATQLQGAIDQNDDGVAA